jgi:hypothetical protein
MPYAFDGRWRATCAVWGKRIKGGCTQRIEDRGETPPTPRQIAQARIDAAAAKHQT